jgi:hypothetical protein
MNKIKITSPAGSGNSFVRTLVEDNIDCECEMDAHQYEGYSTENQIFVLRNPKDTIASGAERHLVGSKDKFVPNDIEIHETDKLNSIIDQLMRKYRTFILNVEDKENILAISFEFLTTDTNKCIYNVAKYFNLNLKEGHDPEMSKLAILSLIGSDQGNRVPRGPKSEGRQIVDALVDTNPMLEELNGLYLNLLNKLQSTESML